MGKEPLKEEMTRLRLILWGCILVFCGVEILLTPLCQPNFRLDVLEQIMVGREWCLGTVRLPALPTWLMQIVWVITRHSDFAPFIVSSFCIGVNLYAIWCLALEYLPPRKALFAVLSMMAYWYFNMGSIMYNYSVGMMLFWVPAILFLHYAFKTGQNRFWLLTGIALGGAMNCKYTAFILVFSMLAFMFLDGNARKYWKKAGPWITIAAALLLFLPHLCFFLEHWDSCTSYAVRQKAPTGEGFCRDLFVGWMIQLGIILPVFAALFPLFRLPLKKITPDDDSQKITQNVPALKWFLPAMFFLPLAVQILLQIGTHVAFPNRSYGFHLWGLTGIYLLTTFQTTATRWHWKLSALWIGLFAFAELVSLPVLCWNLYHYSPKPSARFYPGKALAAEADQIWNESFPGVSCPFTTALRYDLLSWNVAVYSRFQPRCITPIGDWAKDEDLNRSGGIILWEKADGDPVNDVIPEVRERFPNAVFKKDLTLKYQQKNPDVPPQYVGVAVVAPQGGSGD